MIPTLMLYFRIQYQINANHYNMEMLQMCHYIQQGTDCKYTS